MSGLNVSKWLSTVHELIEMFVRSTFVAKKQCHSSNLPRQLPVQQINKVLLSSQIDCLTSFHLIFVVNVLDVCRYLRVPDVSLHVLQLHDGEALSLQRTMSRAFLLTGGSASGFVVCFRYPFFTMMVLSFGGSFFLKLLVF